LKPVAQKLSDKLQLLIFYSFLHFSNRSWQSILPQYGSGNIYNNIINHITLPKKLPVEISMAIYFALFSAVKKREPVRQFTPTPSITI